MSRILHLYLGETMLLTKVIMVFPVKEITTIKVSRVKYDTWENEEAFGNII